MELNEIANLDEVKKALKDKYLKEELGAVRAGYLTLDDLKNQSDDDLRGSWVDWYSDGIGPDDFEEGSYDKDTILKILSDKGTMPTKDEVVRYVSDNLDSDKLDYNAGWEDAYKFDNPTAPAGKSNRYYDGWNDGLFEKNNTKVGGIAKALIAKALIADDLGRSL